MLTGSGEVNPWRHKIQAFGEREIALEYCYVLFGIHKVSRTKWEVLPRKTDNLHELPGEDVGELRLQILSDEHKAISSSHFRHGE